MIKVEVVYLSELPGDADSPAEPVAADQQSLHSPAPEMSKSKYIKVAEDSLPGDNMTVHCILLLRKEKTQNKITPSTHNFRKKKHLSIQCIMPGITRY